MQGASAGTRVFVVGGVVLAVSLVFGCAAQFNEVGPVLNLFRAEQLGHWQLTPAWRSAEPWTLTDGAYQGSEGSWVGYSETFDDFVLECDFLFTGEQGGIVIRGDRDSERPWESGYELDIDWAGDREHGHIHFPVHPQPYAGEALFKVGVWHTVRIEARGDRVRVFLESGPSVVVFGGRSVVRTRANSDRRPAIEFRDSRFTRGHICLEGQPGGVKYRNLRVRRIGP